MPSLTMLLLSSMLALGDGTSDREKIHLVEAAAVRVQGDLDRRMQMTRTRLLEGPNPEYSDEFVLADVAGRERIYANFNGDLSGRYLGALSTFSRFTGERPAKLDRLAQAVLGYQQPDGHFGTPPDLQKPVGQWNEWDMANIYGAGRMLVGLVDYYELTHDPGTLAAARRLGDYLLSVFPVYSNPELIRALHRLGGHQPYVYFLQTNEGLIALSRVTGEAKYLEAAHQLGELMRPVNTQHAHAFLCTLRGMVDEYLATGAPETLRHVEQSYAGVRASSNDLALCEGIPESFNRRDNDEGCTEGDWVRLNLALGRITGDAAYVDRAERALWNEVFFTQFDNGDFGYNAITPAGFEVTPRGRQYFCCTMHGLKTLAEVARAVFGWGTDGVYVNLFFDAQAKLPEPYGLEIRQQADLFGKGEVRLELTPSHSREIALRIRIPEWTDGHELLVNGVPISASTEQGYATISRAWQPGDVVVLRLRLKTVCVCASREGRIVPVKALGDGVIALRHGPLVLAAFESQNADYVRSYPRPALVLPSLGEDGSIALARAEFRPDYLNQHAVLVNSFALLNARFVVPTADGHAVTLTPLAERTGDSLAGRVDLWFHARGER